MVALCLKKEGGTAQDYGLLLERGPCENLEEGSVSFEEEQRAKFSQDPSNQLLPVDLYLHN